MKTICMIFGAPTQGEIDFYKSTLNEENDSGIINGFQKDLIFNLFYKYFGDVTSIKAINIDDYIILMLIAKKMLQSNCMVVLPYIISSKMNRIVPRKNVNKKELTKLENSPYYGYIVEKYKSEKIQKYILSIIATILSSEFQIIDYNDKDLNGKIIECVPEITCEEILIWCTLI